MPEARLRSAGRALLIKQCLSSLKAPRVANSFLSPRSRPGFPKLLVQRHRRHLPLRGAGSWSWNESLLMSYGVCVRVYSTRVVLQRTNFTNGKSPEEACAQKKKESQFWKISTATEQQ